MKRKYKWIISVVSAFVATVCIIFGNSVKVESTKAESYALNGIKTSYCIGETIIIEETVDIDVNGTSIEGKSPKFVMPDGIAYGDGTYVLTEAGEYQLYYFGKDQNKEIIASETILVNDYTWAYSSSSSAEYGQLTRQETISGQANRVAEGIILDLAEGDSFTFGKKLNIANLKEFEVCQIYPGLREETTDTASASMVVCRIVDSYNPDVFVDFYVWAAENGGFYCGAGAHNQKLGGLLDHKEEGSILFEGVRWRFVQRPRYTPQDAFGKPCSYSTNCNTDGFAEFGGMKFSFDLETNRINLTNRMTGDDLITDLDSEELYGENIFTGFVSDEVYAVIQCYGYVTPSVNLQIESLLGYKGEELKKELIKDNKAPEVFVNVEKTDEGGVYVVKGQEYVIPTDVEVLDFAYNNNMQINVYYNYGTTRQALAYTNNGIFIPTKDGKYTIEYKATDIYGNSGVATLDLCVVDGNKGIEFEERKIGELTLLKENVFPEIVATGKNKEVSCKVSVIAPNGETTLLGNALTYIPEKAGEYEIVYTFADNVYTTKYSYKITATLDGSFLQKEQPQLPAYFIKDANYEFTPLYVQTIGENGLVEKETSIQIKLDDGEYTSVNGANTVKINGNKRVYVKYMCGNEVVGVYEREILDVNYANKTGRDYVAYFQGDYTNPTAATVGFEYTFAGTQAREKMVYANLVSLANFKLAFTVPKGKDNFEKINIRLQEATNAFNSLSISYEKKDGDVFYSVKEVYDGVDVVDETFRGLGAMAATRSVSYSSGTITNNSSNMVKITPFVTDLCVLTVEIEGVSAESVIAINELNNQKLSRIYREQGPMLSVKLPERYYMLDEVYNIEPARLSAVANIANAKDITLTVTAPNGEIAKDINGVFLSGVKANQSYALPLLQSGYYHFNYVYFCETGSGELQEQTPILLNVVDNVDPNAYFVGISSQDVIKLKVGNTHKIREYVVNDNATLLEDMWIQVSVYDSAGTMLSINRDRYTFKKTGYYTVRLWCADASGNIAVAYYNILVE